MDPPFVPKKRKRNEMEGEDVEIIENDEEEMKENANGKVVGNNKKIHPFFHQFSKKKKNQKRSAKRRKLNNSTSSSRKKNLLWMKTDHQLPPIHINSFQPNLEQQCEPKDEEKEEEFDLDINYETLSFSLVTPRKCESSHSPHPQFSSTSFLDTINNSDEERAGTECCEEEHKTSSSSFVDANEQQQQQQQQQLQQFYQIQKYLKGISEGECRLIFFNGSISSGKTFVIDELIKTNEFNILEINENNFNVSELDVIFASTQNKNVSNFNQKTILVFEEINLKKTFSQHSSGGQKKKKKKK